MDPSVSGCSSPNVPRCARSICLQSGSASPSFPWACRSTARLFMDVSVSGCSRPTCHAARAAPVHRAAPLLQVSPVPVEVRRGCSWTRACQGAPRPTCHVARAATIKTAFPSFGTLWFSFLMLFCCCTCCCSCCYS